MSCTLCRESIRLDSTEKLLTKERINRDWKGLNQREKDLYGFIFEAYKALETRPGEAATFALYDVMESRLFYSNLLNGGESVKYRKGAPYLNRYVEIIFANDTAQLSEYYGS